MKLFLKSQLEDSLKTWLRVKCPTMKATKCEKLGDMMTDAAATVFDTAEHAMETAEELEMEFRKSGNL